MRGGNCDCYIWSIPEMAQLGSWSLTTSNQVWSLNSPYFHHPQLAYTFGIELRVHRDILAAAMEFPWLSNQFWLLRRYVCASTFDT